MRNKHKVANERTMARRISSMTFVVAEVAQFVISLCITFANFVHDNFEQIRL